MDDVGTVPTFVVDNFTLIVIFVFMQIIPTLAITILLPQMKNYTILDAIWIYYKHCLIFHDLHTNPNIRVIFSGMKIAWLGDLHLAKVEFLVDDSN